LPCQHDEQDNAEQAHERVAETGDEEQQNQERNSEDWHTAKDKQKEKQHEIRPENFLISVDNPKCRASPFPDRLVLVECAQHCRIQRQSAR
jgi:hypothetical protein